MSILEGCADNIVLSLEYQALREGHFDQDVGNLGPCETVGSLKYPYHLDNDFATDESRAVGRQTLYQRTSRFSLYLVVLHQVAQDHVGI